MRYTSFSGLFIVIVIQLLTVNTNSSNIFAEDVEQKFETVEPILIEETLPNEVGEWDIRTTFDYLNINEEINVTLPQILLFFWNFR